MDAKKLLILSLLILAVGPGWAYFLQIEYAHHPEWKHTASTDQPSTKPAIQAVPTQPPDPGASDEEAPGWAVLPTTRPTPLPSGPVMLGADADHDRNYHMAVKLLPQGASIDSVVLNQYYEEADNPELFSFQNPDHVGLTQNRSLATTKLIVGRDGERNLVKTLDDAAWTLVSQSPSSAAYEIDLSENNQPALRITKTFVLTPAKADPASPQGYELLVTYRLENRSDAARQAAQSIALAFNGPTIPHAESVRQETEIVRGYDDDGIIRLDHRPLSGLKKPDPNDPRSNPNAFLADAHDVGDTLWLGASSNYFNAIIRPDARGTLASADAMVVVTDAAADTKVNELRLRTRRYSLAASGSPGDSTEIPLRVFFGPKTRTLLLTPYYAGRGYDQTLIMIGGCWLYALCTSATLINFLVFVLAMLHAVLRDWGLAIIALVCIVRVILHPITKKSQVSMMKMQKLAPEIERLKKKFGDDKEGFGRAQMELYKTVGFTPVLGCLPMFLQMPIFIALWRALQTTFELRQAPFLRVFGVHLTWIHDLSQPDQLFKFATPIPLLFGWHLEAINLLPVFMAVVTFINQKYFMPRPAALSPEQEQQQKMMQWMTLVFPFMFYALPSGLNLYYLTTTTLGIVESKLVRNHIKEAEALEALHGPVIVDAGRVSRASRRRQAAEPQKKGWLQRLQERAEHAVREAERRKKG